MKFLNVRRLIAACLVSAKAYSDMLASSINGAFIAKGVWDASTGVFPSVTLPAAIKSGWVYKVSVAGIVDGIAFNVGDRLDAIIDNPSTTVFAGNWFHEDFSAVQSVNGRTGDITGLQESLGFIPENVSNKSINIDTDKTSDTKYASVKSTYDWATGLFQTLANKNALINPNFAINQRVVTGTVTLAAGAYGHDRWKAGTSGCTYTFSTSAGITTLTITAGSLLQVIEGGNLPLGTATCVLSWTGTAQGKIDAGSYSASGVTGVVIGGANATVEFNTGTLSQVQFEKGTVATAFERRKYSDELALCQYYFEQLTNTTEGEVIATGMIQSIFNAQFVFYFGHKRIAPSVTITNNWQVLSNTTITPTAIAATQVNIDRCKITVTGSYTTAQVGNGCLLQADGTTGLVIAINAEL